MQTQDYLQQAKARLNIKSDYALAKWLGVTMQTMSGYTTGRRTIDDYAAAKLAQALGIDPMEIIAAANWEREKDSTRKEFWAGLRGIAKAACLVIFVGFSTAYNTDAQATDFYRTIHYAK